MQGYGVPVVSVWPGQRPVLDEYACEKCGILQWLGHQTSLFAYRFKIPSANRAIRELNLQGVATKRSLANHVDHSSPPICSICPSDRAAVQLRMSASYLSAVHSFTSRATVGGNRPSITLPLAISTRARKP